MDWPKIENVKKAIEELLDVEVVEITKVLSTFYIKALDYEEHYKVGIVVYVSSGKIEIEYHEGTWKPIEEAIE